MGNRWLKIYIDIYTYYSCKLKGSTSWWVFFLKNEYFIYIQCTNHSEDIHVDLHYRGNGHSIST